MSSEILTSSNKSYLAVEAKEAIKATKSGKATGPSEVAIEMLKAMDDKYMKELLSFFEHCRRARTLPDGINEQRCLKHHRSSCPCLIASTSSGV